jgi:hypothetical protein
MRSLSPAFSLLLPILAVAACSSQTATTTPPPTGTTTPVVNQPAPAATTPQMGAGMAPVVDHTYSIASGEFIRVFLEGGATYRAELDGTGITLLVRPIDSSVQSPLVEQLVPGTSAGGSSLYTIKPRSDAEYEIRSQGGDPARPVTLHLTRQATANH